MSRKQLENAIVKRHARVLRVLRCLQAGPNFNATELADRLNVSRRTVYRDLRLIRDAGVAVYFDEEHSGYRLSAHFPDDIAPPAFSEEDLSLLLVSATLSPLQAFPDVQLSLRESISRLLGCYQRLLRAPVARLVNSCEVAAAPAAGVAAAEQGVVLKIFESIRRRRRIRLQLRAEDRWINVAVYRFFSTPAGWRVLGHSRDHEDLLTLPLEQLQDAVLTDTAFTLPPGFRLGKQRAGVLAELLANWAAEGAA